MADQSLWEQFACHASDKQYDRCDDRLSGPVYETNCMIGGGDVFAQLFPRYYGQICMNWSTNGSYIQLNG